LSKFTNYTSSTALFADTMWMVVVLFSRTGVF